MRILRIIGTADQRIADDFVTNTQASGYQVETMLGHHPVRKWERVAANPFDLIILDYVLKDGFGSTLHMSRDVRDPHPDANGEDSPCYQKRRRRYRGDLEHRCLAILKLIKEHSPQAKVCIYTPVDGLSEIEEKELQEKAIPLILGFAPLPIGHDLAERRLLSTALQFYQQETES